VATGRFRQDLFYRLKVFTIRLPPLRERPEDLPLLVDHFIKRFNPGLGKHVRSASAETLDLLVRHDWPGNVRELQSAVKYALVHAAGEILTPECLPEILRSSAPPARSPEAVSESGAPDIAAMVNHLLRAGEPEIYRKVSLAVDRVVLETVLRYVKGNQVQASE